ncbi:hypothetical protein SHKM778_84310 [Streptomyces sp. KM77-8]|uniref:Uncharacterized protein n=1 Tax=Streptomyces haneummycinicus TaxID=3074435 RepID=A0AAT9HX02_9ACTN
MVYCAYWGRGYACNPAAIHAKARELAPRLRSVFLVEADQAHTMPDGVEYAVIGSHRSWEMLARATYLVNNANFAEGVVKRPGSVHLQTQHGTPLKTMGIDQSTYPVVAAASGSFTKLLGRVDRWDYNLSANPHSTRVWERAFPGSYEHLEYGYPRNDVYCTAGADDVARVRAELGIPGARGRCCTRPRTATTTPASRPVSTWRRSARRPARTSSSCCAPTTSTTGAHAGTPAGSSTSPRTARPRTSAWPPTP